MGFLKNPLELWGILCPKFWLLGHLESENGLCLKLECLAPANFWTSPKEGINPQRVVVGEGKASIKSSSSKQFDGRSHSHIQLSKFGWKLLGGEVLQVDQLWFFWLLSSKKGCKYHRYIMSIHNPNHTPHIISRQAESDAAVEAAPEGSGSREVGNTTRVWINWRVRVTQLWTIGLYLSLWAEKESQPFPNENGRTPPLKEKLLSCLDAFPA